MLKNLLFRFSFTGIFVIFLTAPLAFAQDTVTGAFQGNVSNNRTNDPIAGVSIHITNLQTGIFYDLITDSKGRFYQGLLAPGSYEITISVPGFGTRRLLREIRVSLTGDVVPIPVSLEPETLPSTQPAVLEQPDDVRIEINTTDARRGDSTKSDEITKIPIGSSRITRSFDELALLLPGVAPPPQTIGDVAGPGVGPGVGSAGQFSVNGLRSRANNFTVDGSDNNDEDIGVRRQGFVAFIPQPVESIQEFQITTLLAPAQFGRNIGAQINAVSRYGGNKVNGSIYGSFNSAILNGRNFFDSANGNDMSQLRSATGQPVLFSDGQPLTVRNSSGGEDPFTFGQTGGTLGGPIVQNKLFYFLSGEYQQINESKEKSFSVPTLEQRGPFGTGATGLYRNPFIDPNPVNYCTANPNDSTRCVKAVPNDLTAAGLYSLFPFPNDPKGIFGANTFNQILPASGKGVILSARLDQTLSVANQSHTLTGRYNFTDDEKYVPAVDEAIFSTVLAKIQTQNLSIFDNGQLNGSGSDKQLFNQFRFSFGRTHLKFNEVRDAEFLIPSDQFPDQPFLLNAPIRFNLTQPSAFDVPNAGPVIFSKTLTLNQTPTLRTAEELFGGPLGKIDIAGFSSLGTDVYNFPQNRINKTYQLADELTLRFKGHSFAWGADIRRTDLNSDLPRLARPLLTFNGVPRLILDSSGNFVRFPTASDPNPIIRPEDLVGLGAATTSLLTLNVDRPDSKVNLRYYQLNSYWQDTWQIRSNLSVNYGLRYEYNTPVREVNRLIENTFTDTRLSLAPGLERFIDGRTRLYDPDRNNFGPRVGLAWSFDPFGKSRLSVLRAGYGLFYDQILGAVANQTRNVFPTFLTFNFAAFSGSTVTALEFQNPLQTFYTTNSGQTLPLLAPGTTNTLNPAIPLSEYLQYVNGNFPDAINATLPARKLEMPMAHHYSFVFEQQLNSHLTFSAGYVGTLGRKLLRFTTPNLGSSQIATPTQLFPVTYLLPGNQPLPVRIPLGILRPPDRPFGEIGAVNIFETNGPSTYNSLQTQFRGRFVNDLSFQLSYTWSKATDEVSDVYDLAGAYALPQNTFDLKAERGPANFDIRHRLAYQLIYFVPDEKNNKFLHYLSDGLQIASVGGFHTGQPFTVNSIIDVNLDGNLTDRLNTTQGIEITGDRKQPLRLTSANTLSLLAAFGQDGQVKRNSFRAGSVLDLNLSVIKQFAIGSGRMSFRTDIFNFINRANFGIPIRLLEAPGFGKATNTVTPARRVQFSLKYEF